MYSLLLILAVITMNSCKKDDEITKMPIADFEIEVSGEAPNAQLIITNLSKNADSYVWKFGEGADIERSEAITPTGIIVAKKGEFNVTLLAT